MHDNLVRTNYPTLQQYMHLYVATHCCSQGIDLQPRDLDGKSDPYIKIKIGNTEVIDDKDNYIPSNLNPIFGKMFEFSATFPLDHTLTVSVMDWDRFTADDLIGETKIDLEKWFLSQHRATCGLPESFSKLVMEDSQM